MYKTVKVITNIYKPLYVDEGFRLSFDENNKVALSEKAIEVLMKDENIKRFIKGEEKRNTLFFTQKNIDDLTVEVELEEADMTVFTVCGIYFGRDYCRKPYTNEQQIIKLREDIKKLDVSVEDLNSEIEKLENERDSIQTQIEKLEEQIDELRRGKGNE